jgi:hypothetical protein
MDELIFNTVVLLDFWHVCEYLAAAALRIEDQPAAQSHWLKQQRQRLKTGDIDGVNRTGFRGGQLV